MGVVRNLPVTIGRTTYYIQAQVVRDAPYRLLLGRPFSALTGCTKHDDPNGDTLITLTDPNNPDRSETLPTLPRNGHNPTGETFFMEQADVPRALGKIGLLGLGDISRFFPVGPIKQKGE